MNNLGKTTHIFKNINCLLNQIKMPQQPIQRVREYKLKIIKIIDETPTVKTFRVEIPQGTGISFFPGQFFMVRMPDNPALQRAYSIATAPMQKNYLDITLELVGEFTKKLFQAKVNDYLIFKGPYGRFYFTEEIKNGIFLISGGCGISAMMSIIRYCTEKKLQNKLSLIYSVKTPADIVYYEEIKKIKGQNPNFNYTITITRPMPGHKWSGRTGRIDVAFLKEAISNVESSLYFLCGPMDFVKSIMEMLESIGVKKEQIRTDVWGH